MILLVLSGFITLINSVFFYIYSQFWTSLLIIIYLYSRVRVHLIKYRAIIGVIITALYLSRSSAFYIIAARNVHINRRRQTIFQNPIVYYRSNYLSILLYYLL